MKSVKADNAEASGINGEGEIDGIVFVDYTDESQLDAVMSLVGRDLSEPYSSTSTVQMWIFISVGCSSPLVTHMPAFSLRSFHVSIFLEPIS